MIPQSHFLYNKESGLKHCTVLSAGIADDGRNES